MEEKQKNKAQKLFGKFSNRKLKKDDLNKAAKRAGNLGVQKDNLLAIVDLTKHAVTGKYKLQPLEIATLVGSVAYVVCPIDAIPDIIPVAGWADDVGIIGLAVTKLGDTLSNFKVWKSEQPIVEVKAPKSNLQIESEIDEATKRYLEDVKFMLADGVIDDDERIILESRQLQYGITEEQALKIEKSLTEEVSEESEEMYIEDVIVRLEDDGIIDSVERIILNARKEEYGISESRAKELEDLVFNQLYTDNEKIYADELWRLVESEKDENKQKEFLNILSSKLELEDQKRDAINYRFGLIPD